MYTCSIGPAQKPLSYPFSLPSDLASHPGNTQCLNALFQPPLYPGSGRVAQSWPVGAEKSTREDSFETECSPP